MSSRQRSSWLILLCAVIALAIWKRTRTGQAVPSTPALAPLKILQQFEAQEAQKYWAPELEAQRYGETVDRIWDAINRATNKLMDVTIPAAVRIAEYSAPRVLSHGVAVQEPNGPTRNLQPDAWHDFLVQASRAGWELVQCEFRQNRFAPQPPVSTFYFSAHLQNPREARRAILEGDLQIRWGDVPQVDATSVQVRSREGAVSFELIYEDELVPVQGSYFIDPLMVWDLDGDGVSEIILAAKNRVYRRGDNGNWSSTALCAQDPGLIFTAVLGDFNGDGALDFLCAKFDGLYLYEGSPKGTFNSSPRQVWAAQPRLKYAQAIALGDVDGDGDLDLFLGQYKVPYDRGQMPKPYFDANDAYPSFLLLNDGNGNFTDTTQKSGLGAKRGRRIYNASLVDLDGDGDLDLLTVSDFAGLDAYANDGKGNFRDASSRWFPDRAGLGMASCVADFNRDGLVDVLMIGMNSPTADRLGSLGLSRPYDLPDGGQRSAVTFGNRLLFGTRDGVYRHSPMSLAVARTGWSWGCAAEDFDNDGYPDLYVANGHETRASVRDYDPEFWLHDIYVGSSDENSLAQSYFREKMGRTRGAGWSYGGYEKNRFFLNLGGTNFVECGWLMGLALESDSRNVATEDLDGDGRLDLIVTTFEVYPRPRQTLQMFRNGLEVTHRAEIERLPGATGSTGSYRSQAQPRKISLRPVQ